MKINKPGKSYTNCIRLDGCHQCDRKCKEYLLWLENNVYKKYKEDKSKPKRKW